MTPFDMSFAMPLSFSWSKVIACVIAFFFAADLRASPDWMRRCPDGVKLSELNILGTHNACALHGGDYGQCQSLGLRAQLDLGVRFIDIRCQWRDGDLHIVHGIADQNMRFSEVAKICQEFLRENPSETVMMSVMEQSSKSRQKGDFGRAFGKIISKSRSQWYQKKLTPSLGDARGKVIVVSRNREIVGVPWSSFRIQDSFRIDRKNTLDEKWDKVIKHFKGRGADGRVSINFTSCVGIFNPPNFTASKINPKLVDYLKETKGKRLGVVVVDFFTAEIFEAVN